MQDFYLVELIQRNWGLSLIVCWVIVFGFKFETISFGMYINGVLGDYSLGEDYDNDDNES